MLRVQYVNCARAATSRITGASCRCPRRALPAKASTTATTWARRTWWCTRRSSTTSLARAGQIERQYQWLWRHLAEVNRPENRARRPWIIGVRVTPDRLSSSANTTINPISTVRVNSTVYTTVVSAICAIMDEINTRTEHNMKSICRPAVAQWTERLTRKGQTRVRNWKGANILYHTTIQFI